MIEEKIKSLEITLPNPPTPAGSYIPAIKTGNLLFISGQIPMEDGKVLFTGKVTDNNLETAQKAASDLFFEIFGDKGKHSRIAVGVACLPLNSMTEIDAVIEFSE